MLRLASCWWLGLLETIMARARGGGRTLPGWSFRTEVLVRFMRHDWAGMRAWPIERLRRSLDRRPYGSAALRRVRCDACAARTRRSPGCDAPRTSRPGRARGRWCSTCTAEGSPRAESGPTASWSPASPSRPASARSCPSTGSRPSTRTPRPSRTRSPPGGRGAGTAAHDVVVAGESAGGWLALALLLALRDGGEELPAAGVLISPLVDPAGRSASWREHDRFDYGDADQVRGYLRAWAGPLRLDDPVLALGGAELHGLPPLLVQTGGAERLRDENVALAESARAAGVEVTLQVLPDMPHAAPLLHAYLPEARAALDDAAAYIREQLRRSDAAPGARAAV